MNKKLLIERIKTLSDPLEPLATGTEPKINPLSNIRCIVFDFYGTMFISGVGDIGIDKEQTENSAGAFHSALEDSGFTCDKEAAKTGLTLFEKEIQKYRREHVARGIDYPEPNIILVWNNVLEKLKEKGKIEGDIDRDSAERFAVEFEFRTNPVWPMPGLLATLKNLHSQKMLLGIISNSQFYTPLAFEALTGNSFADAGFQTDLLVWSYRAGVKKPSELFYREFLKVGANRHQLEPGEVLFVGNDMLKDIKPAGSVGMKTALFAGDLRSYKPRSDNPNIRDVEPDLVITELDQLTFQ